MGELWYIYKNGELQYNSCEVVRLCIYELFRQIVIINVPVLKDFVITSLMILKNCKKSFKLKIILQ